ncbi:hypothetical protein JD507_03675 [Aeromonas jandaei]|uniref:hypothetical protein n=1 Tax=Aeromonas jandaei TaxID=650 RepID=UPI00191F32A0|nr:hypothetical protein [Aeromonas jandaei]MBL0544320.1 hypothetical protein [Aeromonas jandaei]
MKIETLSNDEFKKLLDERLLEFGGLRTPGHIEYFKKYYNVSFEDLSFGVFYPEGEIIVLLTRHMENESAHYGWYGQSALLLCKGKAEQQRQAELVAQAHLLSLLQERGVIDFQESSSDMSFVARALLVLGISPRVYSEQIIRLVSDKLMLSDMRKVFRQNINWGASHLECKIIDAHNVIEQDFLDFEEFHVAVAGRRTRSHDSWVEQMKLVQTGENFLVVSHLNETLVGMSLFAASGRRAYYSVGVYERELFHFPLSHYPIWLGILHSRDMGCVEFSMGESVYKNVINSLGHLSTEKECNISHFKRGFGGDIRPSLRFYGDLKI